MNTLISIVMAIVLNLLGVEVQERKLAANAQTVNIAKNSYVTCTNISACIPYKTITEKIERNEIVENNTSIRIEHNYKLSK